MTENLHENLKKTIAKNFQKNSLFSLKISHIWLCTMSAGASQSTVQRLWRLRWCHHCWIIVIRYFTAFHHPTSTGCSASRMALHAMPWRREDAMHRTSARWPSLTSCHQPDRLQDCITDIRHSPAKLPSWSSAFVTSITATGFTIAHAKMCHVSLTTPLLGWFIIL